jgi:hypothetical protein
MGTSRVEPGKVLGQSLADCEAYWNAEGTLTAAQERWRENERELRTECAAQGLRVPAADDPTIAEIRSGAKESRDQPSMETLLHDKAHLARLKPEGHSFPPRAKAGITFELVGAPASVETAFKRRAAFERAVSSRRAPNVQRVAEPQKPVAVSATRSRERRAGRASTSSPGSPDGSEPPLDRPLSRAERDYLRVEIDKRRRIQARHLAKLDRELFDGDPGRAT